MGLKDPEEASRLIGVDPQSNYNTIEIKSKLDSPDNFSSVFGDKISVPPTAEQKAIQNLKKAVESTSLTIPGFDFLFFLFLEELIIWMTFK
jgi:hypothetical protein